VTDDEAKEKARLRKLARNRTLRALLREQKRRKFETPITSGDVVESVDDFLSEGLGLGHGTYEKHDEFWRLRNARRGGKK
jgi:hypothetical protein